MSSPLWPQQGQCSNNSCPWLLTAPCPGAHSSSFHHPLLSNSTRASQTLPSAQLSLSCKNWAPTPRDRPHTDFFFFFFFRLFKLCSSVCEILWGSVLDWNSSSAVLSTTWLKSLLRFNTWFWFIKTKFPQWAKNPHIQWSIWANNFWEAMQDK